MRGHGNENGAAAPVLGHQLLRDELLLYLVNVGAGLILSLIHIFLNSRDADVISGPIGIVIAGSLLGEITAGMAAAVGESPAKKILIPVNNKNHCHHLIVGCQPLALGEYIKLVLSLIPI